MVNFSPPLAFVPSPIFLPPVAPLAPPIGIPGLTAEPPPGELPGFLQPFPLPPLPGREPVPIEPGSVPDLPLPDSFPREGIGGGDPIVEGVEPPFRGGQMPGILYRVSYQTRQRTSTSGSCGAWGDWQSYTSLISAPANVPGPIGVPTVEILDGGTNSVTNRRIRFGVTYGSEGLGFLNLAGGSLRGFHTSCGPSYEFRNFAVARVDGEPDTGGDPPGGVERVEVPNPARAFQPNRIRPFRRPRERPRVLPEINPAPQTPPLPPLPQTPDSDPGRRPDRRVPGPPLPIGPVTPPEIVPFAPGTIPRVPTFPQIVPTRTPQPPRFPELPPLLVPVPPTEPTRPPQFPPLPPEAPTKRTPPVILVPPPLTRIPPPVNNDCCAVPEVIRQGNSIRRLLDGLGNRGPDDCVDLCEPAVMLDIICQGGLGIPITTAEQAVTVLDLSSALGRLSRQVFEIAQYLNICNPFPDTAPGAGGGCGPGVVGPAIFAGQPGGNGQDIGFGAPPEGEAWVGAIARYVASPGVGVVPSSVAPNRAYTQVVGNVSLRYGVVRGVAQQVRSEWNEVIRPVGAPYATGVYVAAIPQTFVTIFPVSVTIGE